MTVRVRIVGLLVVVTVAVVVWSQRVGALPSGTAMGVVVAGAVGVAALVVAVAWADPPGDAVGLRLALGARNVSLVAVSALAIYMAAFTGGRGGHLEFQPIAIPLAIATDFAVIAVITARAVWYGRRPEALEELRVGRRHIGANQGPHPRAYQEVDLPWVDTVAAAPAGERRGEDVPTQGKAAAEPDLVELTGGDDGWGREIHPDGIFERDGSPV